MNKRLNILPNERKNSNSNSNSMPTKSLIPTLTFKQLTQIQAQRIKSITPHILNLLLGSLINSPNPQNGLCLYNQMLHQPTTHNHFTFTHAIKACSIFHALHKGQEIHSHVLQAGHFSDIFIQNSLIHFYTVVNDIDSASQVFDTISSPDLVSWSSIISGLSRSGFEGEAIRRFSCMEVTPNATTLVGVLSACTSIRDIKIGKAIYCYSLKFLRENNIVLDNAVLGFYTKCGSLRSARYVFENMPERDVFSWTIMVGGLAQRGLYEEAIRVFQEMLQRGEAEPNEATVVNVLTACSSLGALSWGQWVHSYLSIGPDLEMDGNIGNALLNMYAKCGHLCTALQVFNMLTTKDLVSWSTLINGMAMNGHGKHALPLFSLMLISGVLPDDVTFIGLLSACSQAGLVDDGLMFFGAMSNVYRIEPQMQHYACVVDMYGRAGLLEEAEEFIREMPVQADGPIWGALLNAITLNGNVEMFERISRSLPNVNGVSIGTFALLSNSYANTNRWGDATEVRHAMRHNGLKKMAGCSWLDVNA